MSDLDSTDIIGPIVYAVSHRDTESDENNRIEADRTAAMVERLEPGDALEELLAAQVIGLNEVFSAVLHDFLNGKIDPMKLKAQASIVNLARVTQGHVDRLKQLKKKRTGTAAPPAPPPPRGKPGPKAKPEPVTEPEPALAALAPDYKRPKEPDSWLDRPFEQWLEETPADQARAKGLLVAEAPPSTGDSSAKAGGGTTPSRHDRPSDPREELAGGTLAGFASTVPPPGATARA